MPGQATVFPDDFLRPPNSRYPILIGGSDSEMIGKAVSQKIMEEFERKTKSRKKKFPSPQGECHFRTPTIDLDGEKYYLVLEESFLVFDPPLESRSRRQGSKALYHAAHKDMGLLLHSIPANCLTSSHYHRHWTEITYLLTGKVELKTCQNRHLFTYQLTEASPIGPVIGPGTIHQISTQEPALILIEITGDPDKWFDKWLTGQEHYHQQFPEVRQFIKKEA